MEQGGNKQHGANTGKLNLRFLEACKCLTEKPDLAQLKELVEQGADINAHDSMGFAALKWATHIYDRDVMRFFLDHGANKEIKDASGQTALDIALSKAFLKTACHIDPNALVEYYKRADKAGIDQIKTAIIDSFRAGMHHYRSNKEGCATFSKRGDAYEFEDYIDGASPPVVSTYKTDADALQFLYDINRSYGQSDETELAVYQKILRSLQR